MFVVVDSNIFVEDFFLERADLDLMLRESYRETFRLVVPQLVKDETVNKFRERLIGAATEFAKGHDRLRGMRAYAQASLDIDRTLQEYELALDLRLQGAEVLQPGYPTIAHELVVRRSLGRRKPFDLKGRGYRDALLWEHVTLTARDDETILLTHNTRDFADPSDSSALHPDLIADLEELGLADKVTLFTNVGDFLAAYLSVDTKVEEELRVRLEDEEFRRLVFEQLATTFSPNEAGSFVSIPGAEGQEVADVSFSQLDVESAYAIDEDDTVFAVELSAMATVIVSFLISQGDLYAFSDSSIEVHDPAMDDYWALASVERYIRVDVVATYTPETRELGEMSLIAATPG
jgi:hypothetical protein